MLLGIYWRIISCDAFDKTKVNPAIKQNQLEQRYGIFGARLPVAFAAPTAPKTVAIRSLQTIPAPPVVFIDTRAFIVAEKPAHRKIWFQFPSPFAHHRRVRFLMALLIGSIFATPVANAQTTNVPTATFAADSPSHVIEAAGAVEFITGGGTSWNIATNGLALKPGDKVRTRVASRAAVQLSDRSVIRLSERTTLEILPPRRAEKKRFGLPGGSIFFFNREKPADVEFDTPLAAGAIRGTEFLLEVAETDSTVHLALIDGLVALNTASGKVDLKRGEDLRFAPGQPPQKTALVNATAIIQWALYYPAVINSDDLQLDATESAALKDVLEKYHSGDLLAALAAWPASATINGDGPRCLRAQLELAVGRVNEAEKLLAEIANDAPAKRALTELISTIRDSRREETLTKSVATASERLAHSYTLQARTDLPGALAAAKQAVALATQSGIAHARLAELEFSFGHRAAALSELKRADELSPRLAPAAALQGFVLLDHGFPQAALVHFDRARELDAAFGPAWLGRGLCLMRERKFDKARAAFQAAAALEPQRGLFRSYLGKAASELGDAKAAEKEFNLAKQLDANDPTAWLYSALHLWQENRLNEAIRDLEKSSDLNDNRAAFRSSLLLDQDRAVRSANLAALYDEAGIPDASRNTSTRAINESYADFSGHLFRASSLAAQESANRFDLRLESARQSELLVANLLAPPGAGNLSQTLSQQEHLRFFDAKPVGVSLLSEYTSNGDWRETGTAFGTVGGFSYAFDAVYQNLNGQQPNSEVERREFALTMKQRVTPDDEAYFQLGFNNADTGDVANYYDPAQAKPGFRVHEKQEPTLYAGWHHAWSPGSHTLLLFSRLDDQFSSRDPNQSILFLQTDLFGNNIQAVQNAPLPPPPTGQGPVQSDLGSDFTLYSAELQHILETPRYSVIVGGRAQSGSVKAHSVMSDFFLNTPNPVTDQSADNSLQRADAYAYGSWQMVDAVRIIGGASYTDIRFPRNLDLPPIVDGETSRNLLSPKAGLLITPWERGLLRASYTKSLGGLYFDNSVRLEPTQVGGFNQAFRSLAPESVAGLVPGTAFETISAGFDQSLASGTFFGIETEQLSSNGEREAGAFRFFTELLTQATATTTRETLKFRERNLSVYAAQLLGDSFSVGARYRVSEAKLVGQFPDIPDSAIGLDQLEQNNKALLHQLSLTANFHHICGVFAQWESAWYHQSNSGYTPTLADEDVWQHNLMVGYRFPHRYAEVRLGLLNIFDTDYRLNPLNLHSDLSRVRMLTLTLRLNF